MKILKIHITKLLTLFCMLCGMGSCSDPDNGLLPEDRPETAKINIGGMVTNDLEVSETRAVSVSKDAETETWLVDPLMKGLDVTYGLYGVPKEENHEDVAILQLQKNAEGGIKKQDGLAVYTFTYRADRKAEVGDGNEAIWYNNGYHYFQGVHVPDRIRYTTNVSEVEGSDKAPGITTDQHDAAETGTLGNYTLLSHYLGMPANYRLTATVERIKLPFRHRLARVVAFVLIDPELKTTLKGYKKDADGQSVAAEDPTTTSIRFCNVQVLQGVKDVAETNTGDGGHHTLTPYWGNKVRKVIPHFDGERGSYSYKEMKEMGGEDEGFKYYYKESDTKSSELYPTSADWKSVHDASDHKGYTEVNYGKVPVYDIIVRPTYTNEDNVMYDEDLGGKTKAKFAEATNSIDFEIELENGLRYEKHFEFDLNANYQTVVYLRISREHVDYNAAGSDLWLEEKTSDGWYGVNNENGNTLSKAGSSWQRAYTFVDGFFSEDGTYTYNGVVYPNGVTDGQFYNADKNENDNAQYYTAAYDAQWIEKFLQANKEDAHHGDYFILRKPITIDATKIPKDFVFTGHLDGQDNTISLTNVDKPVYKDAETLTELYSKPSSEYEQWSIPTLHVKLVTPVYYKFDELAEVDGVSYVKETLEWVETEYIHYTPEEVETENAAHRIKIADEEHHEPDTEGYVLTWEKDVDINGKNPGEPDYILTYKYEDGYTPITTSDVKDTILAHYKTKDDGTSKKATTETVKEYVTTYPIATSETTPAYPTTLEHLKTPDVYYVDEQGTPFVCPALYQYSHNSPAYLFYGLNGVYRTNQEDGQTPWEANVHQEKNSQTMWVPTLGYRAEVLNVRMVSPAMLFMEGAVITGNVQNCFNSATPSKETAVTHTPNIPQYK